MPFDDSTLVTYRTPEVPKFIHGREGARQLMTALREILPTTEWRWNFRFITNKKLKGKDCGTAGCAIGFAQSLWPKEFGFVYEKTGSVCSVANIFEMTYDDARETFFFGAHLDVSPGRVADRIEKWLRDTEESEDRKLTTV